MDFLEPDHGHIEALMALVKSVYKDTPEAMLYDHEPSDRELMEMFQRKLAMVEAGNAADIIAVEGSAVVGECEIVKNDAGVGMVGIIVRDGHRSKGVGAELLELAMERAWQEGMTLLRAEVSRSNRRAASFFKKTGFKELDTGDGKIAVFERRRG